jgi:23S rRNA pseudouridine1911/1915/1917 synthase
VKKKAAFRVEGYWERIDHYLTSVLPSLSRSRIEKLIRGGSVTVNGALETKKSREVQAGDLVAVETVEDEKAEYAPSRPLVRLFEDEWLLAIDKPPGLAVHPGAGEKRETILDLFRYFYPQISEMAGAERPGIVHRLDKDTSGALLLAKTGEALEKMQGLFQERLVEKTYLALVRGHMRFRNGTIDRPLARSLKNRARFEVVGEEREDGREAVTGFSVVREFPAFTFVRLMPRTGRTHQLRVHLAHFGNPVLGDVLYNPSRGKDFPRLALHAFRIEFDHPFTGNRLRITSPLPRDLRQYMIENIKSQAPDSE